MVYSVKMRSAEGGAHELGGKHISGAERIVGKECLKETMESMLERALSHSRGEADFINITVEKLLSSAIKEVPCLSIQDIHVADAAAGLEAAKQALVSDGVTPLAASIGIEQLTDLRKSMRGALLLCASTGRRLDYTAERGIRVSRMDIENEAAFIDWLQGKGYQGIHIREALVLASKVVSAPGVIAELCWSDDPEYTAGYVACAKVYTRFNHLKAYGSEVGGRVFFAQENTDIECLIAYLQEQPVLVKVSS